jgi:cobaltochelatase CobN
VAREIVRHDQWQEFMDVYVRDKHKLGLKTWFEQHNPHALAQSIERMLEAARHADPRSVAELKARYNDLAQRFQVRSDNATFKAFVQPGFGLQQAPPAAVAPAAVVPPAAPPPPAAPLRGLRLERVPPPQAAPPVLDALFALWLLALALAGGVWQGWRADARALRVSPARWRLATQPA